MTHLIGIAGLMNSGKSTVAALIMNKLRNHARCENVKLAQPLYDIQNVIYEIAGLDLPYPKDRELLQWIGSEWGRKKNPDIWVNAWGKKVASLAADGVEVILCDDLRFDNEAQKIKDAGGKIVQVVAPDSIRQARGSLVGNSHQSEKGISPSLVDAIIHNDGNLYSLEGQVMELLSFWEIL